MTDTKQKSLDKEQELAYYKCLLKKHESLASAKSLQSSAQQFQNSGWKQPVLPVYKMVKNSSQLINSSKPLHSSSKLHLNMTNHNNPIPNKRTVLYNQSKYFKPKPGVSSQTSEYVKYSNNKVVSNKRTIINNTYSNACRKVILNSESNSRKVILPSNDSEKVPSSESEELLNEIEFLTQLLKNSTENKVGTITNTKSVTSGINIANDVVVHKNVFENETFNKVNLATLQNINEYNITPITVTVNYNSSQTLSKQSSLCNTNLSNKNDVIAHVSAHNPSKSSNTSKYSLKKVGLQQTLYSKVNHLSKVPANKVEKLNVLNSCNSDSHLATKIIYSDCKDKSNNDILDRHHNLSVLQHKAIAVDKLKFDKRMSVIRGPAYNLVNKRFPVTNKVKSPVFSKGKFVMLNGKPNVKPLVCKLKSPVMPKSAKFRGIYTKINEKHMISPKIRQQLKNNFVYRKVIPETKMKNVNSKYKVINKSNSTVLNKNVLNKQSSSESKENYVLLDKSDSFELLDDSAIDNLEQRLLAISTSMTATSTPVSKHGPTDSKTVPRSSTSKVNFEFCQKKTPLKKRKVLSSKYKVVNKNVADKVDSKLCLKKTKYKVVNKNVSTPPRSSLKRKNSIVMKDSAKKVCKKVVLSKFSIVNKPSSVNTTPTLKGRSTLVKRLYKSKSTIINKNDNSVNHSAKLIKSKYLGLNKRKLPSYQKHVFYPKVPLRLQRFKGHFKTSRLHTKFNRYEKSTTFSFTKGAKRFSKYSSCITNRRYPKNHSRTSLKRKLNGYGQSPVLVIHGTRYSLSSAGKTLRKLPSKGQTRTIRTPKRILVGGRSYVRTSENVMKVVPLVSVNLASRVLHRSINRALTASNKKNLIKVNTYCMFYNRFGRCNKGLKCTYIHDPSKIAVCTRFLRGTCKIEGCPFSHEVTPGKMAICSFFLVDACEKNDCPYRHERLSPDAVLCKAFVQGYCPNGKECKKAHILICPKFILGECEKGSSCAFPHPPQKVKKAIEKDTVEKTEMKKEEDILLEQVARYFQPLCQFPLSKSIPEENDTIKLFVPKQRKLEEQPAFIPLTDTPVRSKLEQSE